MATTYTSKRQLARAVGIHVSTLCRYMKRRDFPRKCPKRMPPDGWNDDHAALIKVWRTRLQPDHSGKGKPSQAQLDDAPTNGEQLPWSERDRIRAELDQEKLLMARLRRETEQGQLIPRHLVDSGLGGLANVFCEILDELRVNLPATCAGRTAGQIESHLDKLITGHKRRLIEKGQYELMSMERTIEQHQVKTRRRGRPAVGSGN